MVFNHKNDNILFSIFAEWNMSEHLSTSYLKKKRLKRLLTFESTYKYTSVLYEEYVTLPRTAFSYHRKMNRLDK